MRRKSTLYMDPMPYPGARTSRLAQVHRPMHFVDPGTATVVSAGINAAAGAVGGGGGGPTVVPLHQQTTTNLNLGDLPPELEGMDIEQLLRQLGLSEQMIAEAMNVPGALSYDSLSKDAFTMDSLGEFLGGMDLKALPGEIGDQVRKGYDESLAAAEQGFNRQIDRTVNAIGSARSTMGLRGSTSEAGQIASSLGALGESRRGFMGDMALGRAQGIQAGYGLQGQLAQGLAGTLGNLMLGQRGQTMGLRGMFDSNRQALLSDPTFGNLLDLRKSTGSQNSWTDTQYGKFD